jgi:hypothetical protein
MTVLADTHFIEEKSNSTKGHALHMCVRVRVRVTSVTIHQSKKKIIGYPLLLAVRKSERVMSFIFCDRLSFTNTCCLTVTGSRSVGIQRIP